MRSSPVNRSRSILLLCIHFFLIFLNSQGIEAKIESSRFRVKIEFEASLGAKNLSVVEVKAGRFYIDGVQVAGDFTPLLMSDIHFLSRPALSRNIARTCASGWIRRTTTLNRKTTRDTSCLDDPQATKIAASIEHLRKLASISSLANKGKPKVKVGL